MKTTEYKLSAKLKELGVKQNSCFYWDNERKGISTCIDEYSPILSLFLLDELLEMLPASLLVEGRYYRLVIEKESYDPSNIEYEVQYEAAEPYKQLAGCKHENPAEAAGLLLAECIEKGWIKNEA